MDFTAAQCVHLLAVLYDVPVFKCFYAFVWILCINYSPFFSISGVLTIPAENWYNTTDRGCWRLPTWIFTYWAATFILMRGVAIYLIWINCLENEIRKVFCVAYGGDEDLAKHASEPLESAFIAIFVLYGILLVLEAIWFYTYCGKHAYFLSSYVIVLFINLINWSLFIITLACYETLKSDSGSGGADITTASILLILYSLLFYLPMFFCNRSAYYTHKYMAESKSIFERLFSSDQPPLQQSAQSLASPRESSGDEEQPPLPPPNQLSSAAAHFMQSAAANVKGTIGSVSSGLGIKPNQTANSDLEIQSLIKPGGGSED